eukprot:TRINITY_DN2408_c0_g1_i9.p2 TRINITY_DN2408_c0_g1~~TRINITY_DN2408_c0_g1_i9.p2  ORF type:complete len:127 (+),score=66.89 TRINITY_DN2408_c0_g1_i9:439-819(+)
MKTAEGVVEGEKEEDVKSGENGKRESMYMEELRRDSRLHNGLEELKEEDNKNKEEDKEREKGGAAKEEEKKLWDVKEAESESIRGETRRDDIGDIENIELPEDKPNSSNEAKEEKGDEEVVKAEDI